MKIEDYDGSCPNCGSLKSTGEPLEVGDGAAWQIIMCDSCGSIWWEVYKFDYAEKDD